MDKQSAVSSFLLAQGKVIIINQYQILDPSKDMAQQLDAAKTQAQKILKELGKMERKAKRRMKNRKAAKAGRTVKKQPCKVVKFPSVSGVIQHEVVE